MKTLKSLIIALGLVALSGAAEAGISGQGTWETTLQARDINGDGVVDAYYDTALNVVWLDYTKRY